MACKEAASSVGSDPGFGDTPREVVAFCMVRRTTHPHPIGRGRWTPEKVAAGARFHGVAVTAATGPMIGCMRFGFGLALAEQPRPSGSQASQ